MIIMSFLITLNGNPQQQKELAELLFRHQLFNFYVSNAVRSSIRDNSSEIAGIVTSNPNFRAMVDNTVLGFLNSSPYVTALLDKHKEQLAVQTSKVEDKLRSVADESVKRTIKNLADNNHMMNSMTNVIQSGLKHDMNIQMQQMHHDLNSNMNWKLIKFAGCAVVGTVAFFASGLKLTF